MSPLHPVTEKTVKRVLRGAFTTANTALTRELRELRGDRPSYPEVAGSWVERLDELCLQGLNRSCRFAEGEFHSALYKLFGPPPAEDRAILRAVAHEEFQTHLREIQALRKSHANGLSSREASVQFNRNARNIVEGAEGRIAVLVAVRYQDLKDDEQRYLEHKGQQPSSDQQAKRLGIRAKLGKFGIPAALVAALIGAFFAPVQKWIVGPLDRTEKAEERRIEEGNRLIDQLAVPSIRYADVLFNVADGLHANRIAPNDPIHRRVQELQRLGDSLATLFAASNTPMRRVFGDSVILITASMHQTAEVFTRRVATAVDASKSLPKQQRDSIVNEFFVVSGDMRASAQRLQELKR